MLPIIQEIIFPIMQYSEQDEDNYQNDTIEYIRQKFGELQTVIFKWFRNNNKLFILLQTFTMITWHPYQPHKFCSYPAVKFVEEFYPRPLNSFTQ